MLKKKIKRKKNNIKECAKSSPSWRQEKEGNGFWRRACDASGRPFSQGWSSMSMGLMPYSIAPSMSRVRLGLDLEVIAWFGVVAAPAVTWQRRWQEVLSLHIRSRIPGLLLTSTLRKGHHHHISYSIANIYQDLYSVSLTGIPHFREHWEIQLHFFL